MFLAEVQFSSSLNIRKNIWTSAIGWEARGWEARPRARLGIRILARSCEICKLERTPSLPIHTHVLRTLAGCANLGLFFCNRSEASRGGSEKSRKKKRKKRRTLPIVDPLPLPPRRKFVPTQTVNSLLRTWHHAVWYWRKWRSTRMPGLSLYRSMLNRWVKLFVS